MIHILAPGIDRKVAGRVSTAIRNQVGLAINAVGQPESATGSLFSLGHGCACEFLHDDADWDKSTHRLDVEKARSVAKAIQFMREASGTSVLVTEARWHGEPKGRGERDRSHTYTDFIASLQVGTIPNGRTTISG